MASGDQKERSGNLSKPLCRVHAGDVGRLVASRQMRASPAPSPVATRPALPGQDGNDPTGEEGDQDHDQPEDHGQMLTNRIEPAQARSDAPLPSMPRCGTVRGLSRANPGTTWSTALVALGCYAMDADVVRRPARQPVRKPRPLTERDRALGR